MQFVFLDKLMGKPPAFCVNVDSTFLDDNCLQVGAVSFATESITRRPKMMGTRGETDSGHSYRGRSVTMLVAGRDGNVVRS
jgi:hypothetical protein